MIGLLEGVSSVNDFFGRFKDLKSRTGCMQRHADALNKRRLP
jgi:hypothetical protein